MPGFTHLQTAQPITFGFYMLAVADVLGRDVDRLRRIDADEAAGQALKHAGLGVGGLERGGSGVGDGDGAVRRRVAAGRRDAGSSSNLRHAHLALYRAVEPRRPQ